MLGVVVRHGEAVGNSEGRFLGRSDPPLTAKGYEDASRLAHSLRTRNLASIIASDYQRAHQTASVIGSEFNINVFLDSRLREVDHGEIDNWLPSEIEASPFGPQRAADKYNFHTPSGESYKSIESRILSVISDRLSEGALFVTHLGPMRVIMKLFGGLGEAEAAALNIHHSDYILLESGQAGPIATLVRDTDH